MRDAAREVRRMYQLSHGGFDPIPNEKYRELFELGWVDEVKWETWETYCTSMLNQIEEDDPGS